jgi:alpha-1,2-mannosyltransferase
VIRVDRLAAAALPIVSMVVLVVSVLLAAGAASSQGTLGFDFLSYDSAVRRFLAGGVLYDQGYNFTGGFGLFYYPPPFVLLALPLTVLPPWQAAVVFTGILLVTYVAAVALMPVSRTVRWVMLLIGGISWPLVYAIKLGQVGPILLFLFVVGWRWMDGPWRWGTATAIGIAIKIQPALLLGWAFLTGRYRLIWATLAVFLVLALAATLVAGPGSWVDQATLLARLSKPIATPHNYTPGRIAFEFGASETVAWLIQLLNWGLVALVLVYAARRTTAVASYLAFVTASQLISPILWDHYAIMLLLPVAWLLSRGHWWAVLIPLATSWPMVVATVGPDLTLVPPITYPVCYWLTLIATVWLGRADRRALDSPWAAPRPVPYAAA